MSFSEEIINHQGESVTGANVPSLCPVRVDQSVNAGGYRVICQVALVFVLKDAVDTEDAALSRASHRSRLLLRRVHLTKELRRVFSERHEARAVDLASDPISSH